MIDEEKIKAITEMVCSLKETRVLTLKDIEGKKKKTASRARIRDKFVWFKG